MDSDVMQAAERIARMERCFDALCQAAPVDVVQEAALRGQLRLLTQYYEGGQWLRDYELDERGLLPPGLKRGVLAQDAVYDLLDRLKGV